MKIPLLITLTLAAALCSRATPEQETITAVLAGVDSPPSLFEKIQRGARLMFTDIQALARYGVPADALVGYLRSTGVPNSLTTVDVDQLRAAGVSERIVSYLLLASPLRVVKALPSRAPRYGSGFRGARFGRLGAFGNSPGLRAGHGHRGVNSHHAGHHGGITDETTPFVRFGSGTRVRGQVEDG